MWLLSFILKYGGAIRVNTGSLFLDEVSIKNSNAAKGGGGLAVVGVSAAIIWTHIHDNRTDGVGGGVWVNRGASFEMQSVFLGKYQFSISYNNSAVYGRDIFGYGADLSAQGSTVVQHGTLIPTANIHRLDG